MKYVSVYILLFIFHLFSTNTYSQLWKQYSDSARKYQDQNDPEKAINYYVKALKELERDSTESLTYAGFCNAIGNNYLNIEKYRQAEPYYLKGKAIREKILGNYDPVYAGSCNNLGILYENLGDFERSLTYHKEALQIRAGLNPVKEHPSYTLSCNNIAVTYVRMGRHDLAEPYYNESMRVREKNKDKDPYDYAESCNNLGALYMDIGLYEKAEPLYFKAMEIWGKDDKNNSDYSSVCNNLALLYLYKGDYERSEPLFLEAVRIDENTGKGNSFHYAVNCDNLALLYREIGQYKKAEKLLLESKKIKETILKNDEHPDMAKSYSNLGGLYRMLEQTNLAEEYYLKALKIRAKSPGKLTPDYALTSNDIGSLYAASGRLVEAEPYFLKALSIRKQLHEENHFEYSICCNNLGNLYKDKKQYKKAEGYFIEAKRVRAAALGIEHYYYADLCYEFAALYRVMHNKEKARQLYEEAFQSNTLQLNKFFRFTSESEKQTYIKKTEHNDNALLSFFSEVNSGGKQGFCYNVSLTNRNRILLSSKHLKAAVLNSQDTGIINKFNTWSDLKKQIAYFSSRPAAQRPVYLKELEEKANTAEKELTLFSNEFKKEQTFNDITWQSIRQRLKADEAAIEFVDFWYYNGAGMTDSIYYIAILLRNDMPEPVLIRLFEKKQLLGITRDQEANSIETRINFLYTRNTWLYNLVWRPLEKYLGGIKKIYFSPAGELFKISLPALAVNQREVLNDKYRLVQLNTTAAIIDNAEDFLSPSDKICLYGGVQYNADTAELKEAVKLYHTGKEELRSLPKDSSRGGSWGYLYGTQQEVNTIETLATQKKIAVQIIAGISATEESVKSLNSKTSPAVLHIATHGFFFPDPTSVEKDKLQPSSDIGGKIFEQSDNPLFRSGLVFAGANNAWKGNPIEGIEDGILTAYEVSNLYLPNTKLVVLSACETALGDIQGSEGVYGLQRAFKMAGVQNLVMSLWQVGDKETAEFMQLFYKNLFNRQSVNDAFYNAQTIMKNKYRNEPYKWAAWVLVR